MIHLSKKHYWILSIVALLTLYITYALANWNYSDSSLIPSVSEQEAALMARIEKRYKFNYVSVTYQNNYLSFLIEYDSIQIELRRLDKDSLRKIAHRINDEVQPIVSNKNLADSVGVNFFIKGKSSFTGNSFTFPIKK